MVIRILLRRILVILYQLLDSLFVPLDRKYIRRTRNIRLIPKEGNRKGGKYSYAEWAHVIGIFQTLILFNLRKKENNVIFDVGCGTGLMGIASEPFLGDTGKYVGIDVSKDDIEFCQRHYPINKFNFIHFNVSNATFAPTQESKYSPWPVENESMDLVTAVSVWTHLNEEDSLFYFKEIYRILKPGSKAIVTFFLLDQHYKKGLGNRTHKRGTFHMTFQDRWIFDQPAYGSKNWLHPKWVKNPENAIGVTEEGLLRLISTSGLKLVDHHQGNWKEEPGVFFQDILVFEKSI